jgi:uncharacterized protein
MKAADADAIIRTVAEWAMSREDVRAMALVGSWARGNPHQGSDIDLLLLSDLANEYRRRREWLTEIDFKGAGHRILSGEDASYGVAWSRHVALLPAGKVELTFAQCSWARIDPVDVGTRSVVKEGFRIVIDRDATLAELLKAMMSS